MVADVLNGNVTSFRIPLLLIRTVVKRFKGYYMTLRGHIVSVKTCKRAFCARPRSAGGNYTCSNDLIRSFYDRSKSAQVVLVVAVFRWFNFTVVTSQVLKPLNWISPKTHIIKSITICQPNVWNTSASSKKGNGKFEKNVKDRTLFRFDGSFRPKSLRHSSTFHLKRICWN